jgi:uncharacterized protein (DUF58 family)
MINIFRVGHKAKRKSIHKTMASFDAPLIDGEDFSDLENQAKQVKPTGGYAHRLESHFSGTLPTKKMGSGMDYAESRVYQAGDDPRFINWRLTARSNETLVKNFHTESSPTLCVLMDRGATMRFGTRKRLKITQAARVSTLLSLAARQHRLALGGLVLEETSNKNRWFPASKNDHAFNDLIDVVSGACLPSFIGDLDNKPQNWQLLLRNLADKNPLGSLIYLVSDFSDLNKEHQSTLEALQAQHHVIAIHIYDIAEQSLANNGTLRFKDSQSNALYQVESASNKQREQFQARAQAHQKLIKKTFEDRGIPFISISTTDDDLAPVIPLPLEAM